MTVNIFNLARKLQGSGYFGYLVGNTEKDLLDKIVEDGDDNSLKHCQEFLLRKAIQQPTAIYCGSESVPNGACCCYAHIVERPMSDKWKSDCEKLDEHLRTRLQSKIAPENLSPDKVLECIKAEGKRVATSKEWEETFKWLTLAMPYVCNRTEMDPQYPPELEYRNVVEEVRKADRVFTETMGYSLWPTQVAAVLLNVYGVASGTKLIIQMKTGEGKTNVCGVSAAVVAKLFNDGPAVILTSSIDRACEDKKDTTEFIFNYLGHEPIFVKELKPGSSDKDAPPPGGQVAYGMVSDAQRIVVDMLTQHNPKGLYEFLKTASFFLDEADHVLIEQAESLLYIASPCPSYYALHGVFFNIQYRIDYEGDFKPDKVKTRSAIQGAAEKLTKRVLEGKGGFDDYEREHGKKLPGGKLHPTIIDLDSFVSASASGAMSARFKENEKEYVIEVTSEDEHGSTIPNVEKITIVDVATGTESDGTRWTTEAPFCEAMEGLPVGGSDPLAFYNAFPYLRKKLRWFGGITGTIGATHTLKFYEETYGVRSTFKIPRNKPTTVYRLPTKVANNEDEQVDNICASVMGWMQETINVPAKGPVLIIAESIQKARKISKKLQERGHALMKANMKEVDKDVENEENEENEKVSNEVKVESWTIQESPDCSVCSGGVCAHLFPYYCRNHYVMEEFPDCAVVVASNKGGRGLDLKLDHEGCPEQPGKTPCPLNHHRSTLKTKMGSVLFVILTEVLPGRQDEQAVGRCGRKGKAGVVQYLLSKKKEDSNPISDPEAVYLERKNKKDSNEGDDLNSKSNRIAQHCFDGFVLDTFCENLSTYVQEWMLKLFPRKKRKKKSDEQPNDDEDEKGDETILVLKEVITKWFLEYNIQMWAYWRSYGGSRRGSGDSRSSFETRMGLVSPVDLPESESKDPLQRLARRFWRFSCKLRLSGEALYTLAKALLAAKNDLPVEGWCIDILKVATSPKFEIKLPPQNHTWQPEFTGNAALLLARLLAHTGKEPDQIRKAIDRAIDAINSCIVRYINYDGVKKKTKPEKLDSSNRSGTTYYHVQRVEIVRQLEQRKESLERLKYSNEINSKFDNFFKHISEALEDTKNTHTAYCLCYGLCEVVFEWYVDEPFVELGEETKKWMNLRKVKARELGAEQGTSLSSNSGGGGGGGSTAMKTEEQMNKLEKEGKAILARLDSETEKQVETNSENEAASPKYEWQPTAPTKDDIRASKQTMWQTVVGWLSFVWEWLITMITAPVRKYKSRSQSNGSLREKTQGKQHPIWDYVSRQMSEKAKNQVTISGDLVSTYIGDDAKELIGIVDELGPLLRHTDLFQEDVQIRTDGKTSEKVSRSEAMKQANEEAADQVHLRDETLSKEDMYLISKTLEALKKMAGNQQLEGFDDRLSKLLEAIAQYNEFAQDGKVDSETARRMNEGMKAMWQNILRFALEHGSKIKDLKTALDNYNICKTQSEFTETTKKVVTKVKDTVQKIEKV